MEEQRILFEGIDTPDVERLAVYRAQGGGAGLRRARGLTPEAVLDEVAAAGLRGRGGAWRPVAERWRRVRRAAGTAAPVLLVDLLEAEAGRFRDRKLAERQPQRLLEGIGIAAHALGAESAYVCIAAGAARARANLAAAIDEGRADAGVPVHLHPVPGRLPVHAGDSLPAALVAGGRPEPRADDGTGAPPRVAGRPAAVHSATTLAFLPRLLADGADAFRRTGSDWAPGTQAFCVSGLVRRPGLYEVDLGAGTFGDLVEGLAGGARAGRRLKFVLHAGYGSRPALRPADLSRSLDPGAWAEPGGGALPGGYGAGAVLVADDTVCAVDTAARLAARFAAGSCGLCLPCREGTAWIADTLARLEAGAAHPCELELLAQRCAAITPELALCGHGPSAAAAVRSLMEAFAEEFAAHLEGECPVATDPGMKVPESIHVRY